MLLHKKDFSVGVHLSRRVCCKQKLCVNLESLMRRESIVVRERERDPVRDAHACTASGRNIKIIKNEEKNLISVDFLFKRVNAF